MNVFFDWPVGEVGVAFPCTYYCTFVCAGAVPTAVVSDTVFVGCQRPSPLRSTILVVWVDTCFLATVVAACGGVAVLRVPAW